MLQRLFEYLETKEPTSAPSTPRDQRPHTPALYETMRSRGRWIAYLFLLTLIVKWSFQEFSDTPSLTMRWLGFSTPIAMLAYFLYGRYIRRRWRTIQKEAKAADYLICPTCRQDLHGTPLQNSSQSAPSPSLAADSDIVTCPECGDGHMVKLLPEIWEFPIL